MIEMREVLGLFNVFRRLFPNFAHLLPVDLEAAERGAREVWGTQLKRVSVVSEI